MGFRSTYNRNCVAQGRRSLSDQVEGAAEYIKHLQEHIKEISRKREDMRILSKFKCEDKNCKVLPL